MVPRGEREQGRSRLMARDKYGVPGIGADGEDWEKVVKRERQRTCANVWNFPRGEVVDENL